MDKEAFEQAKVKVLIGMYDQHGFGTLQEKTVHSVMKMYYEPNPDYHEVPVEGYIADIYKDGRIIEIQNGNFNKLRDKLKVFLPLYKVTVVHPIPHNKWLVWLDKESGEISPRRKSPITGSIYNAFPELYKIKPYLKDPNLSFAFPLIDIDEYRLRDVNQEKWKKRGTRYDRMPIKLYDEIHFECKEDFVQVIPAELEEAFTVRDFAKAAHIQRELAQITLNVLYSMKIVKRPGKRGKEYLYEVVMQ